MIRKDGLAVFEFWYLIPHIGYFGAVRAARRVRANKDWGNAARYYEIALRSSPTRATLWVQYGHALKESGDRVAAEAAYNEAVKRAPDVADTYVQLGHVTKLLGRYADAANHYRHALELKPSRRDAAFELQELSAQLGALSAAKLLKHPPKDLESASVLAGNNGTFIAFDVSDLLNYFQSRRHPTGIQRLQIEVIKSIILFPVANVDILICSYSDGKSGWSAVPKKEFLKICILSTSNDSSDDWSAAKSSLETLSIKEKTITFPKDTFLLTLGSAFNSGNYFLRLRHQQKKTNIIYVPMVYDLIPTIAPENFVVGLVQDFIGWILNIFNHTKHFLVISESTKADLLRLSKLLSRPSIDIEVIRLDAGSRQAAASNELNDYHIRSTLGLATQPYILFVSTIEPRKNHLLVFSAWLRLIRKRGFDRVPHLVCIGGLGWLNEAVFSKLASSEVLQRKVIMLTGISDEILAALYRGSEFTIYPSLYEGWGLPITESLCHGKLALVADVSSLPEAGGDFVEYFDPESEADFLRQLERLIDDHAFRKRREQHISDSFRPREWSAVTEQIIATVFEWQAKRQAILVKESSDTSIIDTSLDIRFNLGTFYGMNRNLSTSIWPGAVAGEVLRNGDGWWAPDDWGCWTKPGGAYLSFMIDVTNEPMRGYLGLKGLPTIACTFTVEITTSSVTTGLIAAGSCQWVPFVLEAMPRASSIRICLASEKSEDLSVSSAGHDKRVVSVGTLGLLLCRESDFRSRMNMLDAIQFNDLRLVNRAPNPI